MRAFKVTLRDASTRRQYTYDVPAGCRMDAIGRARDAHTRAFRLGLPAIPIDARRAAVLCVTC